MFRHTWTSFNNNTVDDIDPLNFTTAEAHNHKQLAQLDVSERQFITTGY